MTSGGSRLAEWIATCTPDNSAMGRFLGSVRNRGLAGTVVHALRRLTPTYRNAQRRRLAEEAATRDEATREFDATYGVETGGLIELHQLEIVSGDRADGHRFEAVLPHEFHNMMRTAGAVILGRTFVDMGSGKGRALLLASDYPFRRIVGVEFAPQLVAAARENLARYRSPRQSCRDIEVVLGDAAEFAIPDEPLVLFFFNPFGPRAMRKVVANLRRSLDRLPRPVTVIYPHSKHGELFGGIPLAKGVIRERTSPERNAGYREYAIYHFG